ncbi:hypothetical protein DPMN_048390 [Dreissena polymorpha]|uniref:Uncharacterized protein n=1 Tax=Dreissena polymorpha TaxID=45954 RepID=A0A9D4DB59_DREPO|nr:hypothetical protein DPMN_048390 [Dreissena polymorpha]
MKSADQLSSSLGALSQKTSSLAAWWHEVSRPAAKQPGGMTSSDQQSGSLVA